MTDEADKKATNLKRLKGIAVAIVLLAFLLFVGPRVVGWIPTLGIIVSFALSIRAVQKKKAERAEFLRPKMDFSGK